MIYPVCLYFNAFDANCCAGRMLSNEKSNLRRRNHIHHFLLLRNLATWVRDMFLFYDPWVLFVPFFVFSFSLLLLLLFFGRELCEFHDFLILNTTDWPWIGKWSVFPKWQEEISKEMAREAGEASRKSSWKQKKERGCICSTKG